MQDLIKRIKADAPSRELDADILVTFFPREFAKLRLEASLPCGAPPEITTERARGYVEYRSQYWFTSSIDAAMTLVPDGWTWSVNSECVANVRIDQEMYTAIGYKTPALALCAAALRARQEV